MRQADKDYESWDCKGTQKGLVKGRYSVAAVVTKLLQSVNQIDKKY